MRTRERSYTSHFASQGTRPCANPPVDVRTREGMQALLCHQEKRPFTRPPVGTTRPGPARPGRAGRRVSDPGQELRRRWGCACAGACARSFAPSLVLVKAMGVELGWPWTAGPLAGPGSLAASVNGAARARTHTHLLALLAGRVRRVLALLAVCVCVCVCARARVCVCGLRPAGRRVRRGRSGGTHRRSESESVPPTRSWRARRRRSELADQTGRWPGPGPLRAP